MRVGPIAGYLSAAVLVATAGPAFAAIAPPNSEQCAGHLGFLRDKDPVGRIVRDSPSPSGKRLGVIAPPVKSLDSGADIYASFRIIGSRNGWLQIEGASDETALTELPARAMYHGRGWIAGGGLFVNLQASQAYAEPSYNSARIIQTPRSEGIEQYADLVRVSGCSGEWLLLDWRPFSSSRGPNDPEIMAVEPGAVLSVKPYMLRAWSAGVCDVQETSCEGMNGDLPMPGQGMDMRPPELRAP